VWRWLQGIAESAFALRDLAEKAYFLSLLPVLPFFMLTA
jgi:hypothetical protein